jgi:multicomponent Na+:H+ antiporter subunit B
MNHLIVPRVITKILLPFIMLYALYVQFHGDYSPGGGFQAGVIFAASIILYALIFKVVEAERVVRPEVARVLMAVGLLIYVGTGYLTMFLGGAFLDYNVLAHDPSHGQHYGLLVIEFGVGLAVSAVMITIFYAFVDPLRD